MFPSKAGLFSRKFVFILLSASAVSWAEGRTKPYRPAASSRLGSFGTMVSTTRREPLPSAGTVAETRGSERPRPRLAGYSPRVAIATSNKRSQEDIDYEHDLEPTFSGNALAPPASLNFVVGILDSGAVVDLAAGSGAFRLGLTGQYLTSSFVPIGGVGGTVDAWVTQPVGYFAAGLSAVDGTGFLNLSAMVGHSNVAMLVAPPIDCGFGDSVTAIVGTAFLSFYNTVIRVDTPRRATVRGETYVSPDVQLQSPSRPVPQLDHSIALEIGGLLPVLTASYYPDITLDPEDPGYLITPGFPTALSLTPLSQSFGAVYFATILMAEGEPGPTNLPVAARMLFDTGAQSSIISSGVAANLNLPREPDFTIDACGVAGLITDIPGYYLDYVKISALGGALEFSRAPFVVLDLQSPEGGPLDGVLGMNFFWNRNAVLEPSLTEPSFFHVSDPIPVPYADFDLDLDVDQADAFYPLACFVGPENPTPSAECDHVDLDRDGDLDLWDFARFQACYSGDSVRADPHCGE